MTILTSRTALAHTAALVLAATAVAAGPATASTPASHGGDSGGQRSSGACTGAARWTLKAKPDDGRLEVEAEVDSNHNGQAWAWTLHHDGSLSARGTRRTAAPSGSFEVQRRMVNLSGPDTVVFRATHAGQVCRGTIHF